MLSKRRQYTDIPFAIQLMEGGEARSWSGVTVQVIKMIADAQGGAFSGMLQTSVDTEDPTILHAVWDAHDQLYLGDHRLVMKLEILGTEGSFDCPAVEIVATTAEIDDTEEITLGGSVTIDGIEGNIVIVGRGDKGDKGDTGMSSFEVWLSRGHTGTVDDYIAWIQKPANDAAEAVFSRDVWLTEAEYKELVASGQVDPNKVYHTHEED